MTKKAVQLEFPGGRSLIAADGSEIPDSRPVALPVGFEHPEPLQVTLRRLVLDREFREALEARGEETFEDADDFDVPDDLPVNSPHEDNFDPLHLLARDQETRAGAVLPRSQDEILRAKAVLADAKAAKEAAKAPPSPKA